MSSQRILSFVALLLVAMNCVGYSQSFKDIKKSNKSFASSLLYLEGVQRLTLGDFAVAESLFQQTLQINPTHSAAAYQLSQLVVEQDQQRALRFAEIAYQSDSTNAEIVRMYARALLINNRLDDAKLLLERLRNRSENRKTSYYFSILLAEQMGDDELLSKLAKEYTDNWGYQSEVVNGHYETLIRKKEYARAEELLEKYLTDNPTDQKLLINLARIKAVMMDDEKAIELYYKAIELDTQDYQAPLALSDYYRQKNDKVNYLDALYRVFAAKNLEPNVKAKFFEQTMFDISLLKDYYQQVKKIATAMFVSSPNNAEIDRVMIRFLMYTGELEIASTLLMSKIQQKRADEDVYKNLIEIHLYNKQLDSAWYYADMAMIQFPRSSEFPVLCAVAQWQAEQNQQALGSLKTAYKLAENDSLRSVVLSFEGDVLYKMGLQKQAFRAYDRALKLHSDNASLLNNYAYYLSLIRVRLDDALHMAEKANQLSENNATYLDTQAWVLYELGRYEEAREIQRKAIGFNRNNSSELFLHYGDILYKLGENFLAETYWKRALTEGADRKIIEQRLEQLK